MSKRRCFGAAVLVLTTIWCGGAFGEASGEPEATQESAGTGETNESSGDWAGMRYDVVLLVDGSAEMADLSRRSAHVVTEAMTDLHRLAIMTFGTEVRVLQTLSRIATVKEKAAALQTLNDAAFDAKAVSLREGLTRALEHLEKRSDKEARRIVVLLSGANTPAGDDVQAVKTVVAPEYLKQGVVLFAVGLPTSDIQLLQAAANLTGGKCLAALNVETMTDALDVIIEQLRPPERVVVTKEVPVAAKAPPQKDKETPEKKLEKIKQDTKLSFIIGIFAAAIIVLLVVVLIQLHFVKRRFFSGEPETVPGKKSEERSGFAGLRDLANALGNLLVDAKEMSESLNLDLEDFGVETWKEKKALGQAYRNLAKSIFLVIDHIEVQSEDADSEAAAKWIVKKLKRLLEDEGIEEIEITVGDSFDGLHHKHAGERESDLAPGAILEVKRKGYRKQPSKQDKETVVLRQAEVVVSCGADKASRGEEGAPKPREV